MRCEPPGCVATQPAASGRASPTSVLDQVNDGSTPAATGGGANAGTGATPWGYSSRMVRLKRYTAIPPYIVACAASHAMSMTANALDPSPTIHDCTAG